jgi:hypothetical protein
MFSGALAGGVALLLLLAVVQQVAAEEASGWMRVLARWLVRRAASRLPARSRERYEQEWLAELLSISDRPVTGLVFAIGVRRSARQTGAELEASSVTDRDPTPVSRPLLDPAAMERLVARLVEETKPGRSAWDAALEAMREEDLSIGPDLDRIEAWYSDHVRRLREERPRAGWVERWRRDH